jgi:hypothetical protein
MRVVNTSLHILLGLVIGFLGAVSIPASPMFGAAALVLGGLMILEGIN